jgi:hypothetical protein
VRELIPCKFLVRFPSHKKVSDNKNLPLFNLRKEGVQVGVMEWIGDLDHFGELPEVWVQLEGIPLSGVIGQFSLKWLRVLGC